MFHSNTDRMIQIWQARQTGFSIPARSDLSPMDLRAMLPQVFMLGVERGEDIFRLCGGLVADLYGRDLRGTHFRNLWDPADRAVVVDAQTRAIRGRTPVVLTADAMAPGGETVGVEICLAPLRGPSGRPDRTLGLFQPISMVGRLMGQRIDTLVLRDAELATEALRLSPVRLVAVNGRRVA